MILQKIKKLLQILLLFGLQCPMLSLINAQENFKPHITIDTLSNNLYYLEAYDIPGSKVNCLFSKGLDGFLLVDFPGDYETMAANEKMIGEITQLLPLNYRSKQNILVNTHWHGDHTGANVSLSDVSLIISHRNTKKRLENRQYPSWKPEGLGLMDKKGIPDITFTDSLTIHFNDDDIKLYNFGNAHTDGDAIVFFTRDNFCHMGDIYQGVNQLPIAGNPFEIKNTIEAILEKTNSETTFITGHGGASAYSDLKKHVEIIDFGIQEIKQMMLQNMEIEQILKKGIDFSEFQINVNQKVEEMFIKAVVENYGLQP